MNNEVSTTQLDPSSMASPQTRLMTTPASALPLPKSLYMKEDLSTSKQRKRKKKNKDKKKPPTLHVRKPDSPIRRLSSRNTDHFLTKSRDDSVLNCSTPNSLDRGSLNTVQMKDPTTDIDITEQIAEAGSSPEKTGHDIVPQQTSIQEEIVESNTRNLYSDHEQQESVKESMFDRQAIDTRIEEQQPSPSFLEDSTPIKEQSMKKKANMSIDKKKTSKMKRKFKVQQPSESSINLASSHHRQSSVQSILFPKSLSLSPISHKKQSVVGLPSSGIASSSPKLLKAVKPRKQAEKVKIKKFPPSTSNAAGKKSRSNLLHQISERDSIGGGIIPPRSRDRSQPLSTGPQSHLPVDEDQIESLTEHNQQLKMELLLIFDHLDLQLLRIHNKREQTTQQEVHMHRQLLQKESKVYSTLKKQAQVKKEIEFMWSELEDVYNIQKIQRLENELKVKKSMASKLAKENSIREKKGDAEEERVSDLETQKADKEHKAYMVKTEFLNKRREFKEKKEDWMQEQREIKQKHEAISNLERKIKAAEAIFKSEKIIKGSSYQQTKGNYELIRSPDHVQGTVREAQLQKVRNEIQEDQDYLRILAENRKLEDQQHQHTVSQFETKTNSEHFQIREAILLQKQKQHDIRLADLKIKELKGVLHNAKLMHQESMRDGGSRERDTISTFSKIDHFHQTIQNDSKLSTISNPKKESGSPVSSHSNIVGGVSSKNRTELLPLRKIKHNPMQTSQHIQLQQAKHSRSSNNQVVLGEHHYHTLDPSLSQDHRESDMSQSRLGDRSQFTQSIPLQKIPERRSNKSSILRSKGGLPPTQQQNASAKRNLSYGFFSHSKLSSLPPEICSNVVQLNLRDLGSASRRDLPPAQADMNQSGLRAPSKKKKKRHSEFSSLQGLTLHGHPSKSMASLPQSVPERSRIPSLPRIAANHSSMSGGVSPYKDRQKSSALLQIAGSKQMNTKPIEIPRSRYQQPQEAPSTLIKANAPLADPSKAGSSLQIPPMVPQSRFKKQLSLQSTQSEGTLMKLNSLTSASINSLQREQRPADTDNPYSIMGNQPQSKKPKARAIPNSVLVASASSDEPISLKKGSEGSGMKYEPVELPVSIFEKPPADFSKMMTSQADSKLSSAGAGDLEGNEKIESPQNNKKELQDVLTAIKTSTTAIHQLFN